LFDKCLYFFLRQEVAQVFQLNVQSLDKRDNILLVCLLVVDVEDRLVLIHASTRKRKERQCKDPKSLIHTSVAAIYGGVESRNLGSEHLAPDGHNTAGPVGLTQVDFNLAFFFAVSYPIRSICTPLHHLWKWQTEVNIYHDLRAPKD